MTADELQPSRRPQGPLVRVRGEWVELAPDQISAALHALSAQHRDNDRGAGDAYRPGPGSGSRRTRGPERGRRRRVPLKALLDGDFGNRRRPACPQPAASAELSDLPGARVWAGSRSNDEIRFRGLPGRRHGLGKNTQLLALLLEARRPGSAPGSARERDPGPTCSSAHVRRGQTGSGEAARFAPELQVMFHHGAGRLTADALAEAAGRADLVITTYALAARDGRICSRRLAPRRSGRGAGHQERQNGPEQGRPQPGCEKPRRAHGTPVENR